MEKDCECYAEEVQPYRKTDYKPIIYNCLLGIAVVLFLLATVILITIQLQSNVKDDI